MASGIGLMYKILIKATDPNQPAIFVSVEKRDVYVNDTSAANSTTVIKDSNGEHTGVIANGDQFLVTFINPAADVTESQNTLASLASIAANATLTAHFAGDANIGYWGYYD